MTKSKKNNKTNNELHQEFLSTLPDEFQSLLIDKKLNIETISMQVGNIDDYELKYKQFLRRRSDEVAKCKSTLKQLKDTPQKVQDDLMDKKEKLKRDRDKQIQSKIKERTMQAKKLIGISNNCIYGVQSDGTVAICGRSSLNNLKIKSWKNIIAIACGKEHVVGLKSDGTIVSSGSNRFGQCEVSKWTDIVEVACGAYHTVGLKSDGSVVSCGDNEYKQCSVSSWKNIDHISCGSRSTFGISKFMLENTKAVGYYFGCYLNNELNVSLETVAGGYYHLVGIKKDEELFFVSDNNIYNQIPSWSNKTRDAKTQFVDIVCSDCHTVGLQYNGKLAACGHKGNQKCEVENMNDVIAVTCDNTNTVFLLADGHICCTSTEKHFKDLPNIRLFCEKN